MLKETTGPYPLLMRSAQRVEPPATDSIKIYTWPSVRTAEKGRG